MPLQGGDSNTELAQFTRAVALMVTACTGGHPKHTRDSPRPPPPPLSACQLAAAHLGWAGSGQPPSAAPCSSPAASARSRPSPQAPSPGSSQLQSRDRGEWAGGLGEWALGQRAGGGGRSWGGQRRPPALKARCAQQLRYTAVHRGAGLGPAAPTCRARRRLLDGMLLHPAAHDVPHH